MGPGQRAVGMTGVGGDGSGLGGAARCLRACVVRLAGLESLWRSRDMGMEEGDLPPRGQPRPPPDNVSRRGLSPLMLLASGEQRSRMLLTSLRGAQGPRSSEWSSPKSQQRRNGEIGVRGVLTNSYERLLCVGRRPGDGRYRDRQNGRGVCLPGSLRCCGTGRLERGGGGGGVRQPDFCNLL